MSTALSFLITWHLLFCRTSHRGWKDFLLAISSSTKNTDMTNEWKRSRLFRANWQDLRSRSFCTNFSLLQCSLLTCFGSSAAFPKPHLTWWGGTVVSPPSLGHVSKATCRNQHFSTLCLNFYRSCTPRRAEETASRVDLKCKISGNQNVPWIMYDWSKVWKDTRTECQANFQAVSLKRCRFRLCGQTRPAKVASFKTRKERTRTQSLDKSVGINQNLSVCPLLTFSWTLSQSALNLVQFSRYSYGMIVCIFSLTLANRKRKSD